MIGVEDEIVNVSEPSVCEYVAKYSTPAACSIYELNLLEGKKNDL